MTKKIEIKTAAIPPATNLISLPPSDVETLGDSFQQVEGVATGKVWTYPGPVAVDFDLLRSQVERPKTVVDFSEPKIPSFAKELLPLLPEVMSDGKAWRSTINEIEDHYETRRKELQQARLEALQVVQTSLDVGVVRAEQAILHRLERALHQIDRELETLHAYRNQKLAAL